MSDAMFPCRSVLPSSPRKRGSILIWLALFKDKMDSRLRGNDDRLVVFAQPGTRGALQEKKSDARTIRRRAGA
jgi:hypothetical protein